jgi:hypothetical protein
MTHVTRIWVVWSLKHSFACLHCVSVVVMNHDRIIHVTGSFGKWFLHNSKFWVWATELLVPYSFSCALSPQSQFSHLYCSINSISFYQISTLALKGCLKLFAYELMSHVHNYLLLSARILKLCQIHNYICGLPSQMQLLTLWRLKVEQICLLEVLLQMWKSKLHQHIASKIVYTYFPMMWTLGVLCCLWAQEKFDGTITFV